MRRATPSQIEGRDQVEPQPERPRAHARSVPPFPELFSAYSEFVCRLLLRLGVAESDIDDVAQEVFLGIHRGLGKFEGRCSLRTWIYGICQRRAVDYRRHVRARPDLYAEPPPERTVDAAQEQDLVLAQARVRLRRVLEELDDDKRTVLVLFDIEGRPMEEIAEIANCPLPTAYSRLYAARRKVETSHARVERRSP